MYKILKNIIEMDDYSVQKLSKSQPPEPFEWNSVEGTELNVSDCIGGKGKIAVKGNTHQKSRVLPEGYTQVDYIESHGQEYIDTGVNADSNLRTVLDMQYTNISVVNNTNIGAIRIADGGNTTMRYHLLSQNGMFRVYAHVLSTALIDSDTNRHYYDFDIPNNKAYVDGEEFTTRNVNPFDVALNFYLFARNSDTVIYFSDIKLYESKMYYNSNLIRHFIPCYRNSDNEVGLYDLANNVFYTNDGTGAFTYGSAVDIPNPDYPQEIKVVTGNNVIKNCGKNLFDKNNANKLNGGYIDIYSNKIVTSNNARCIYIPIKENCSYTVSKKVTNYSHFRIATTQDIPTVGSTISDLQTGNGSTISLTLTSSLKSRYLVVWWGRVDYDDENEVLSSLQIEENASATPYEPYNEKSYVLNLGTIELCKIDDYQDTVFKNVVGDENYNAELEVGAWYKKNCIEKDVLDGTDENITIDTKSTNTTRVYFRTTQQNASKPLSEATQLSNCLSFGAINNLDQEGFYAGNNKTTVVRMRKSLIGTDAESVNNYLAHNNITFYFVMSQPTYTKITDTTLISQLNHPAHFRQKSWQSASKCSVSKPQTTPPSAFG